MQMMLSMSWMERNFAVRGEVLYSVNELCSLAFSVLFRMSCVLFFVSVPSVNDEENTKSKV